MTGSNGTQAVGSTSPAQYGTAGAMRVDFEQRVRSNEVLNSILEGRRGNIRNYYPPGQDAVAQREALAILREQFLALGYRTTHSDTNRISADIVKAFQLICGIYEGNGNLIGKKTIESLIVASSAEDWKTEVAGMHDNNALSDVKALEALYGELQAWDLKGTIGITNNSTEKMDLLISIYNALGFKANINNIDQINYKFQIICGSNDRHQDRWLFGPGTYKGLLNCLESAITAAEKGEAFHAKEWGKTYRTK